MQLLQPLLPLLLVLAAAVAGLAASMPAAPAGGDLVASRPDTYLAGLEDQGTNAAVQTLQQGGAQTDFSWPSSAVLPIKTDDAHFPPPPLSWSGAELALPSAQQLDFQRRHPKGCFFHFGVNTFAGVEHGALDEVPSMFDAPADLNTDQWAEACVKLGGTYGVFTAKHEEGMMNWPSNATTYTIETSPFCAARKKAGRSCDIVAEFLASCDKYNISRGIYYTLVNAHCQLSASGSTPGMPINNTNCTLPSIVPEWLRNQQQQWRLSCCGLMLRNAFTELATNYGSIDQFWFDHGNELFVDIVDKYQPQALVLGRDFISDGAPALALGGTEQGFVLEGPNSLWSPAYPMGTTNASANSYMAYQCDTSLSSSGWFWHPGAAPILNASMAVDLWGLQCIGAGAGLILNLPPSTRGIVEPSFVTFAEDFNTEWERRFGAAARLGESSSTIRVATDQGPANGVVELTFQGVSSLDYVIIREDLQYGQRIAGWALDMQFEQRGVGKVWSQVAAGSTIGATRILALGQGPGTGQFVPGQTCHRGSVGFNPAKYVCDGFISGVFGVRFRPTITIAQDGAVYVAQFAAFDSNQTARPIKTDDQWYELGGTNISVVSD